MTTLASTFRRTRALGLDSLTIAVGYVAVALVAVRAEELARLGWLAIATAVLILLASSDLRTRRVRNAITYPAIAGSLLAASAFGVDILGAALLGAFAAFATFYAFALISRGALGMGDVKLATYVGSLLGPVLVFPWLALAMIAAALVAAALLVLRRATRKDVLPLAPFLAAPALALLAAGYGVV
jgi:leader peptidase (prepilin peptidase)/N-methyltransferase